MENVNTSQSHWVTTIATVWVKTGALKPNSMRILRSTTAPPAPADENFDTRRRWTGPPVSVVGLRSEASVDGWDVQVGELRVYPKELADDLVTRGAARLAEP